MNIEAYDAESLRKLVRLLEYENRLLKEKLKKENIPYDEVTIYNRGDGETLFFNVLGKRRCFCQAR